MMNRMAADRPSRTAGAPRNALTVDVEDYFQVSAFEAAVPRGDWNGYESRVDANTRLLLDEMQRHDVRATFFVLGWVAERAPDLMREIRDRGHEIASHGYEHRRVNTMEPAAFRDDLRRASDAIEAACGVRVRGFRAPSFSIDVRTLWAFDVLREEGYAYSSSVFPVRHDRYGIPHFPRHPVRLEGEDGAALWEFPMSTRRVLGRNLPVAGGGWMRVLPGSVMRRAIAAENRDGHPAIVYLHPWEIDPDQPRIAAPAFARWRHYVNLTRTLGRLKGLMRSFRFGTVEDVLNDLESAGRPPALTRERLVATLQGAG
jgi:polysaccharide deacetylase family protein (PEP-CTERM system associated)